MPHTSLRYFTQVLSVISEFNISEEDSLNAAELSELPISDRVKAEHLTTILNAAAKRLNDPLLGIKCGFKYPVLQYTRPSEFLKLCANIQHASDVYKTYCPLFHTVGAPSGVLSEDGHDRMLWVPNFKHEQTDEYRQLIELIMTNFVTSINWLAWKVPNAVRRVNFGHDAILPLSQYQDLFECDVKFGQAEYSLILQDGVKSTPFSTSDPAALAKVCIQFDMALNALFAEKNLIDRIELQIRRSLENNIAPHKAPIAEGLGLSERSMARDLKNNGTSFKDVKNRVLQNVAVAKINQGLPLVEIAHALGYNDQPAFTRAYKRWFGQPPGKHTKSRADET